MNTILSLSNIQTETNTLIKHKASYDGGWITCQRRVKNNPHGTVSLVWYLLHIELAHYLSTAALGEKKYHWAIL